jgi:steroid delta-isomerase-like uncharacterized protein
MLMAGASAVFAQEATPAASPSIAQAYGNAWSSANAAEVAALYTEDAVRDDVPTSTVSDGRNAIAKLAQALFASDDAVRLEVTDGFVGQNWAVVEWTFSGKHPATGREVTFRGASVLELKDGLISEERDYYDLPEMVAQIGAASATPAPQTSVRHDGRVFESLRLLNVRRRWEDRDLPFRAHPLARDLARRGDCLPAWPLHSPA